MSDQHDPIAALWKQYDEIAAVNCVAAAKFALETRLFETPRPAGRPNAGDGRARIEAMRVPTRDEEGQTAINALASNRKNPQ